MPRPHSTPRRADINNLQLHFRSIGEGDRKAAQREADAEARRTVGRVKSAIARTVSYARGAARKTKAR